MLCFLFSSGWVSYVIHIYCLTDSCAVGRGHALPPVWHHCAEEGWMWLAPLHRLSHWDLLGYQRTSLGAKGKKSFLMCLPNSLTPSGCVFLVGATFSLWSTFIERMYSSFLGLCKETANNINIHTDIDSDSFQGSWRHQWRMSLQDK